MGFTLIIRKRFISKRNTKNTVTFRDILITMMRNLRITQDYIGKIIAIAEKKDMQMKIRQRKTMISTQDSKELLHKLTDLNVGQKNSQDNYKRKQTIKNSNIN